MAGRGPADETRDALKPRAHTARLALLALAAGLVACARPAQPEDAALEFWAAVAQRDFASAVKYADARDAASVGAALGGFAPKGSPAIGEASGSGELALVETTFLVRGQREPLAFATHMLRSDGVWRVQLSSTAEALARARIAPARVDATPDSP